MGNKIPLSSTIIRLSKKIRVFETLVDYMMLLKTLEKPINEYVSNEHIVKSFIEGLDEAQAIETIQQSYQTLKEPYNKIRNNLILLDIEFPDLIRPIQESL